MLCVDLDYAMKQVLSPMGLTLGQFAIVMTLLEGDGLTQSEIGRRISMPGYATTRNIDVLEENGLLERRKSQTSRRSFCIQLTEKGKALGPDLSSIVRRTNEKLLTSLNPTESEQLRRLLRRLLLTRQNLAALDRKS